MRRVPAGPWLLLLVLVAAFTAAPRAQDPPNDPLATFNESRRAVIDAGRAVVDVLPADGDDEFGVTGAAKTAVDAERFMTWVRSIEQLHGGKYVPLINRFSSPPRIEDLDALVLDDEELEDLRECRPGRCAVKLSAGEIERITAAIGAAGEGWRQAAQAAFRQAMLTRAVTYLRGGQGALPPYNDHRRPEYPGREFTTLLSKFDGHPLCPPRLLQYLRSYPRGQHGIESFLYWSKDLLGDVKPIVSITHLAILPATADHPLIIAATQVSATHYIVASLSLTGLVERSESRRYIVYARWTRTDVFDGPFGGFVRRMVNRRVRAEGPPVLHRMRDTLESGLPKRNQSTHSAR